MKENEKAMHGVEAMHDEKLESVAGGYYGQVISSGSFSSQTGTKLNLLVNWSATVDGNGQKSLTVTVSATSYSLYAAGLPNGLELSVNGMTYTATPYAINYGGNSFVANTLGSFTVPNVFGPATITASWRFNGSYSGAWLGTITASGVASF